MKQYIGISRDHSGSMDILRSSAMKDYNSQINTIRKAAKDFNIDTYLSVVTCAGSVGKETVNKHIDRIDPLTSYYAGGGTPLFDSVNELINLLSEYDDGRKDTSFLIQVITDGEENQSRITGSDLSRKINKLQETDRWTFTFRVPKGYKSRLARMLSIPDGNIMEWETTESGMHHATIATTSSYDTYYSNRTKGLTSTRGFYSDLSHVTSTEVKKTLTNITSELNIYSVDKEDEAVAKFVQRKTGKPLVKGTIFYELTKYERAIQDYKKIIIQDLKQGGFFEGAEARRMLGLPEYGNISISPGDHAHYKIFVQSTSLNRKLKKGTSVLHWSNVR